MKSLIPILIAALLAPGALGQSRHEDTKLVHPSGSAFDAFSRAVVVRGDVILVGAPEASSTGSAFVFRHDSTLGTWTLEATLEANDQQAANDFGWSVSLSGDRAVIGAPADSTNGTSAGAAFVFHYDGVAGTWTQEEELLASDGVAWDGFGSGVALDTDRVLMGAYSAQSGQGKAYVYRDLVGTWSEQTKLSPYDGKPGSAFGTSVALRDDWAVVGAAGDQEQALFAGAAYAYHNPGDDSWPLAGKVVACDGAAFDRMGRSVAIDAGLAVGW